MRRGQGCADTHHHHHTSQVTIRDKDARSNAPAVHHRLDLQPPTLVAAALHPAQLDALVRPLQPDPGLRGGAIGVDEGAVGDLDRVAADDRDPLPRVVLAQHAVDPDVAAARHEDAVAIHNARAEEAMPDLQADLLGASVDIC